MPDMTLGQLAQYCRNLASELPTRTSDLRKEVARTVNFDLLQVTPVDTGKAVSNWQVTLDAPAEGIRPAYVPSPEGFMQNGTWTHSVDPELTRQANIAPAMELANQVIDSATPDQVIYFANNVPYIKALDEGHSSQAQNFIERATILASARVTRATITD